MAETVSDLMRELEADAHRHPDIWTSADSFDPPFLKRTLRVAAKKKLIELDTSAEIWRFRLASDQRERMAREAWKALVKAIPRHKSPPKGMDAITIRQAAALLGIAMPQKEEGNG